METFTKAQRALSAPPEMTGTLPNGRRGERDAFCADSSDDRHGISPERWHAWEEKSRLRDKANTRKITVLASAALLVLWLLGMITRYTLGGSIHALLLIAVVALGIHVLQSRRSLM